MPPSAGNGVAFVLQNDPAGTAAQGVQKNFSTAGYYDIDNSVAVLFSLFPSSTITMGANGLRSSQPQDTAPVSLDLYHVFNVTLQYLGGIFWNR